MAEKLDPKEIVSFDELVMANTIQTDALAQLLIEKWVITNEEFLTKIRQSNWLSEYEGFIKYMVFR